MNAVITYKEITDFIAKEYKVRPNFTAVDERSFEVSYKPGMFLPAVIVSFQIESVCDDLVCLSYNCGAGASLIIAGAVSFLEEKIPDGVEVDTVNKRIKIFLQRFKQLEKIWEYVSLSDISVGSDAVNLTLLLL